MLPTSDWSELDRVVGLMRVPRGCGRRESWSWARPKARPPPARRNRSRSDWARNWSCSTTEQIIEAHQAVDLKAAEAEAEKYWISQANGSSSPPARRSSIRPDCTWRCKDLMIKERAQAITSSHCMGAPAKGCLTFSKLNDLGLVGACEGDMDSTLTMLMFAYAFGVPGFITDPVIDTSQNALIHFHCTCATKMDGPGGQRLPFTIRTQSDSERGVSLDVEQRIGPGGHLRQAGQPRHDAGLDRQDHRRSRTTNSAAARSSGPRWPTPDAMFHNWGAEPAGRRHDDAAAPRGVLWKSPTQSGRPGGSDGD